MGEELGDSSTPGDEGAIGGIVSGAHRAGHADATGVGASPTVRARLDVATASAMHAFGAALARRLRAGDLVVLTGDLGAGKTTLTQGIAAGLGVRDSVTSPTFVIARVHPPLHGGPALVHVDAYRLGSLAEVDDLDLDASLSDSVTVVEWGSGLVEDLAPDRLEVSIRRPRGDEDGGADTAPVAGDEPRSVGLLGYGSRWASVELPGRP
jgi:tRNA threonylcarbamoyladenosine biosynthesis protein TsaE